MVKISKNYTNCDLASGKVSSVEVFEDRLRYWLLEPLKRIRKIDCDDYDFIILTSIFPMFDCLGMFLTGQSSKGQTKKMFQKGFEEIVWNQDLASDTSNSQDKDIVIRHLYEHVRNGLAHSGITRDKIIIEELKDKPMDFRLKESGDVDVVSIDPWKLLDVFEEWFNNYIRDLKNGGDKLKNFEKTWNRETPEICRGCSH